MIKLLSSPFVDMQVTGTLYEWLILENKLCDEISSPVLVDCPEIPLAASSGARRRFLI